MADHKDDEKKWEIPKKYRLSLDISDEEATELLRLSNEQQQAWATDAATPFAMHNPRSLMRAKAWNTIEALEGQKNLDDIQAETLAENFALIGRYDLAAQATRANREEYETTWDAVFRDDAEDCPHPVKHKYIKAYVFSIKHGTEVPLVKCNVCRFENVQEPASELRAASTKRASIRDAVSGMSMQDVKQFLEENVNKS